ncbi:TetR/AcrR family transcriptional regulator [Euzebya tangerina]|uniref:TetR/AcrR family transcriptional regulator n=1 Tax=Euzebya tangerina TaxID=591198 RepID=UPI000E3228B0|nr:TetR/AcrR family transcriptional regulator [Euzebya tangerina]
MSQQTEQRPVIDRLLEAASGLFYEQGYAATGIDQIVQRSGVAKRTLYRHFPSKDDLIVAYLRRTDAAFTRWLDAEVARAAERAGTLTPTDELRLLLELIQVKAVSPSCAGCTFQGAAAEFPDAAHQVHAVAKQHKDALRARLTGLAERAGLAEPARLADELLLLIDGAWAAARMYRGVTGSPAAVLRHAAAAVIAAHRTR